VTACFAAVPAGDHGRACSTELPPAAPLVGSDRAPAELLERLRIRSLSVIAGGPRRPPELPSTAAVPPSGRAKIAVTKLSSGMLEDAAARARTPPAPKPREVEVTVVGDTSLMLCIIPSPTSSSSLPPKFGLAF